VAIVIPNLERISKNLETENPKIFRDLHLDFEKSGTYNNLLQTRVYTNDIKVDYDESAIRNSIINLFSTRPGQRFLFPLYGMSLEQFLFEPITPENAETIGEAINRAVEQYEPRTVVKKCIVLPKPDDNEYDITLILDVPLFRATTSINTVLDIKSQSFKFFESPTK
jgi:phage baseplate assembly protein W